VGVTPVVARPFILDPLSTASFPLTLEPAACRAHGFPHLFSVEPSGKLGNSSRHRPQTPGVCFCEPGYAGEQCLGGAPVPSLHGWLSAVGSLILSVVGRGGGVAVSRTAYEQLRLVEVSPAGALVQTVRLPRSTAASGLATPQSPNQRMGMSLPGENPTVNKGAYTPQSAVIGLLSRSGLGEWISWAGTSGPVGTPWNNAFMPWTFAMVNYNGTVNTMTASLGHYGVCARAGACVQRPSTTCTHPPPLRPLPHHHPSSIPPRRRLLLGRCNARRQQLLHHRRADLVDAQRLHLWHRPIWPRGGARRLPRQWRHHTHAWQQRPLCDGFAL
jgi:hypothetical protein